MGREKRILVSETVGAYHVMSRIVGGQMLLRDWEKNYFLKLLERLALGFFVKIHAFAILDNHLITISDRLPCIFSSL